MGTLESREKLPIGEACSSFPSGAAIVYPFLASEKSLQQFVLSWENGAIKRSDWTHVAHIAVSAYYAFNHSPEELFRAMKEGIVKFNGSVNVCNGPDSGYHETLTRFWCNIVAALLSSRAFASPLQATRQAVDCFGEKRDLHNRYYSFDVVRSRQARREWIPPDRELGADWHT